MQGVSAFDAALVFFEVCECLGPLSAQRLAERLRATSRAGFEVGSALSNLVETFREVVVSERLMPVLQVAEVIDISTTSEEESDDTWERLFGEP